MNSFNTANLLVYVLNTLLMGEDGAFLSEPVNQLEQGGAINIINGDSQMETIEELNKKYLPDTSSK